MNPNLVRMDIQDEDGLLQACDLLHDAAFGMETLRFDAETGSWEAFFNREFFEDESVFDEEKVWRVFTRISYPLAECRLRLSGVLECSITDRSHLAAYSFNECQVVKHGRYRFLFAEDMEMTLAFGGPPCGRLDDLRLLGERRSWVRVGPFRLFSCYTLKPPVITPRDNDVRA